MCIRDSHNCIDFETRALGQPGNLDGGARRERSGEIFLHHRIDLGELTQIGQVQAQTHDLAQ